MSYRQSSFDPLAAPPPLPVRRPFDRWQWLGVAAEVTALGLFLLWLSNKMGWLRFDYHPIAGLLIFVLGGSLLLRRDPDLPAGALGNRKWPLILTLIGFALLPLGFVL